MNKILLFVLLTGLVSCDMFSKKYPTAMYRQDSARQGSFVDFNLTPKADVKWTFEASGPLMHTPLVTEDFVYFGSKDGKLYCLNKAGQLQWTFETDGAINCSPAIFEKLIYFISEDGNIYAVNARSGKEKWKYETKGEKKFAKTGLYGLEPVDQEHQDPWDLFLSSPLIYKNRVVVGGGDHHIYGLDPATGKLMFRFAANELVHSSVTGGKGLVYIGSWDGNTYALEAVTGVEMWRSSTKTDSLQYFFQGIQGTPALHDTLLIVPSRDANVYVFHSNTGELLWQYDNDSARLLSSPVIYEDFAYFSSLEDKKLKCLDLVTGSSVFEVEAGFCLASPVVAGQLVYVSDLSGFLRAFDIRTGELRFEKNITGKEISPSAWPESSQYAAYMNQMDQLLSDGAFISEPAFDNNTLYIGATNSTLYALK